MNAMAGLSWGIDENAIRDAFSSFGEVREGRSKGYGFVSCASDADAQSALQSMDGKIIMGGEIVHRFIKTNGIRMHIAEQGSGPLVLLLHGFPELWYSWRHQIPAIAEAGYHVVAPDLRGYGQTDAPQGIDNYTSFHVVGDLVGLLDELNEKQAFVVGHDWGAIIAWDMCTFRPDRVKALVALSVPFIRRDPSISLVKGVLMLLGEGFYICRFQEPGKAEADFARFDHKDILKRILVGASSKELPIVNADEDISDHFPVVETLPKWLTEEELEYYGEQYKKSGFTGPLNYYRAIDLTWELKGPWSGQRIEVPALYVTGDRDLVYHLPGYQDYIHKGGLLQDVPKLKEPVILPETGHFMQQENSEEITKLILDFLREMA